MSVINLAILLASNAYGSKVEMGFWRASRYDINRDHILAYHEGVAISAPVEDYEERNALYAL